MEIEKIGGASYGFKLANDRYELKEISLVSIPSNPHAVIDPYYFWPWWKRAWHDLCFCLWETWQDLKRGR